MDKYTSEAKAERAQFITVKYQEGTIPEVGVNGAHIEDVIQVAIDRLKNHNEGPFRCRENSLAITDLESAQNWLVRRTMTRVDQGVEGVNAPHQ